MKTSLLWDESSIEFLKNNWGTLRAREIAEVLGRSQTAVQHKADSLGVGPGWKLNPIVNDIWSEEDVKTLKELWGKESNTAAKIGKEINKSRNHVIGKARRLRLGPGQKLINGGAYGPRVSNPRREKTIRINRPRRVRVESFPVFFSEPTPKSRMVEIIDLKPLSMCCWPYGEPKSEDFRYCGAPKNIFGNSSYCKDHHSLAYVSYADYKQGATQ